MSDSQFQSGYEQCGAGEIVADDASGIPTRGENARVEPPGPPPRVPPFDSILFEPLCSTIKAEETEPPGFFHDLSLDRIVDAITADWEEYNLKPLYYTRPPALGTVQYRQEVMRDLQNRRVLETMKSFSKQMREMRARLKEADDAKRYEYPHAVQKLFLGAVEIYCGAIERLGAELCDHSVTSRGLRAFREFVAAYLASEAFQSLTNSARRLTADLSNIRYCILLKNGSVTVRHLEEEEDYSTAVEQVFAKFRSDAPHQYRIEQRRWSGMNHIEAEVQRGVASLYPETFAALEAFCVAQAEYLDATIARFDREIQFYISCLTHLEKLRGLGLSFCLPEVSQSSKEICAKNAFDLALAWKLAERGSQVVCNDFFLRDPERILVVSGPNQGGKTTFARMIGQLHYLASLGCPVPGTAARLFFFDRLLTHFEREENITTLRGKLQDDLVRIHDILAVATSDTLIIMNEMFSSTTLEDALYLSTMVIQKLCRLDLLGVWVTFIDEIASLNEKTVSIVSNVNPDNPAIRTYKLERRAPDGLAYALAIAHKYCMTYGALMERIQA